MTHFNLQITGLTPLEAAQHVGSLVTTGKFWEELSTDPQCLIDCAFVIERWWMVGRQPGPFGAVTGTPQNTEAQILQELDKIENHLTSQPQAAMAAPPAAIPPWVLQFGMQFILWLISRQKTP